MKKGKVVIKYGLIYSFEATFYFRFLWIWWPEVIHRSTNKFSIIESIEKWKNTYRDLKVVDKTKFYE